LVGRGRDSGKSSFPTRSKADECQNAEAAVRTSFIQTGERSRSVLEGKLDANCKVYEMEEIEIDGLKAVLPLLQRMEKLCGRPFIASCDAACEQARLKRKEEMPKWQCPPK
jgi:hypothetical protein